MIMRYSVDNVEVPVLLYTAKPLPPDYYLLSIERALKPDIVTKCGSIKRRKRYNKYVLPKMRLLVESGGMWNGGRPVFERGM